MKARLSALEKSGEVMASIEKIYGSNEQYDEFRLWIEKNKREYLIYFYERGDYDEHSPHGYDKSRPITNFPERADRWLIANCPLAWVIDRINEQYNGETP